jgi:hypothetical protein
MAAMGMTVAVLVFGLWPEEVARESMRKPYVAGQYVYSNQVIGARRAGHGHQVRDSAARSPRLFEDPGVRAGRRCAG